MSQSPIFVVTGAPAVGKTTFCVELLKRFERGCHVPIDDLREWVVSGFAGPVGWTEETTRQFLLAEDSACEVAVRYQKSGFAVALDHCSRTIAFDNMIARCLPDQKVIKILLLASEEINHQRNLARTNKPFSPEVLTRTITNLNAWYRENDPEQQGWIIVPNDGTVEQAVEFVMNRIQESLEIQDS